MVRQTMRAFFAPELMPAIHTSSFDAASAVRVPVPRETDLSKMGFIEQTKAVSVGIEAIVARGIDEAQRMVVEGVHLVPGFLDRSRWGEAIVLEFVLADRRQGAAPRQLHGARVGDRRHPAAAPLPRALRRDPPHPEVHGRARRRRSACPVIDGPSLDENLSEVLGAILQRVEETRRGGGAPALTSAARGRRADGLGRRSVRGAPSSDPATPGAPGRAWRAPQRPARPRGRAARSRAHDPSSGDEVTGNLLRGMTYSAPEPARTPSSIAPSTSTRTASPRRDGAPRRARDARSPGSP